MMKKNKQRKNENIKDILILKLKYNSSRVINSILFYSFNDYNKYLPSRKEEFINVKLPFFNYFNEIYFSKLEQLYPINLIIKELEYHGFKFNKKENQLEKTEILELKEGIKDIDGINFENISMTIFNYNKASDLIAQEKEMFLLQKPYMYFYKENI